MERKVLKALILDIYEDVKTADEWGNDHNDRKETREKFDVIIEPLKKLCDGNTLYERSKLNMQNVSHRRELFVKFIDHINSGLDYGIKIPYSEIDSFEDEI